MSGSRAELYVYYRVAAADWQSAVDIVRAFQRQLCREYPPLRARVMRRPGEQDGCVTLMETYALDDFGARGVDEALRTRIDAAAAALTPLLRGARHAETFEPLG